MVNVGTDQVKEMVHTVSEKAQSTVSEATQVVSSKLQEVKEKVKQATETVTETMMEKAEEVKDKVKDKVKDSVEVVQKRAEQILQQIKPEEAKSKKQKERTRDIHHPESFEAPLQLKTEEGDVVVETWKQAQELRPGMNPTEKAKKQLKPIPPVSVANPYDNLGISDEEEEIPMQIS